MGKNNGLSLGENIGSVCLQYRGVPPTPADLCKTFFSILELGECSKRKLFDSFLTCILYTTILTVTVQAGEPEAVPGDYSGRV